MARASGDARTLALLAVLVATLGAACGPGTASPSGSPVECLDVPREACDAAVSKAGHQARMQNALLVSVKVSCATPAGCTEEAGEVQYEAVLTDGSMFASSHAWGQPAGVPGVPPPDKGLPPPPVEPTCVGVPRGWCRDLATGIDFGGDPSAVRSIVLTCKGACTETKGEGSTVVTLNDGRRLESGWGYQGAAMP